MQHFSPSFFRMLKFPQLILHPALFSWYVVLTLFATNISDLEKDFSWLRASLILIGFSAIAIILFGLLVRDRARAGILASLWILGFTSYGHLDTFVHSIPWIGNWFAQTYLFLLAFIIFLGYASYWAIRKLNQPISLSNFLNVVSAILIIFPIVRIWWFSEHAQSILKLQNQYMAAQKQSMDATIAGIPETASTGSDRPDIYYIILDAHTRSDVLQQYFHYDNTPFVSALTARGFYVASQSRANYTTTEYSIASSLNMEHLFAMPEYLSQENTSADETAVSHVAANLIAENGLMRFFRRQGYTIVNFESGFFKTQIANADVQITLPDDAQGNNGAELLFGIVLLDSTFGKFFFQNFGQDFPPLQAVFRTHRQRILNTLDHLPDYANREGNYFVFAHIVCPHTPYVFGAHGETVVNKDPFTLLDNHPGQEENIPLYTDQVQYLDGRILEVVSSILQRSTTPPIIIIQGDHSSRVYKGEQPVGDDLFNSQVPILNAYFLPQAGNRDLYPSITPVNSFRIILNQYFNATLPMLPDTSYYFEGTKFFDACQSNPKRCPS
jgi:hypothetical protein